jgi:hypothetical protein
MNNYRPTPTYVRLVRPSATPTHDLLELAAFLGGQPPNLQWSCHPPIKTGLNREVVDANPTEGSWPGH